MARERLKKEEESIIKSDIPDFNYNGWLVSLANHGGVLLALDNRGQLYEMSRATTGEYRFYKVKMEIK